MARTEPEIFDDLGTLCASQGFVHALAFLCFRDNYVLYRDTVTAEDFSHLSSFVALIRSELSTLLGLLVRQPISYELPSADVISTYVVRAETLLEELHASMSVPLSDYIKVEDGVPRDD